MVANPTSPVAEGEAPKPEPRRPTLAVPALACDSHCHIYGPFDRFPLPPDRSFTPHEMTEGKLRHLHDRLGFARAVIVQSQGHSFDHAPLLDALATGAGRYRGVALIRPETSVAEVARFDAAGICGTRFNFMSHLSGRMTPDEMRSVIRLVAPYGWHIAIHVSGMQLIETADFIRSIEAPVVIDHMARPDISEGPDGPIVSALKRLLDKGNIWVKLSGADRLTKTGAPFADVVPLASSLARHAPDRVLWGSDWPHVNLHGPMPDDGDLVDFIAEIAPSDASRHRLLVTNPAAFFGFD